MRCDITGQFVSVFTETWGGGQSGKPAGRRDVIFLLQETGAVIEVGLRDQDGAFAQFAELKPRLKSLTPVRFTVDSRAFASGGRAQTTYTYVYGEIAAPVAVPATPAARTA